MTTWVLIVCFCPLNFYKCESWAILFDSSINSARSEGSHDSWDVLLIVKSDRINDGIKWNGPKFTLFNSSVDKKILLIVKWLKFDYSKSLLAM